MSNLLNLGIDFGLTFFENKEKVSRKKYLQENVDYYKQGLDDTGIKVDYERDSDEDEGEDRNRDVDITQVGVSQNESNENSDVLNFQQTSGKNNIISNAFTQELGNTPSQLLARENKTYGKVLAENGFKDRSPTNLFGLNFYSATLPKSAKEAGKNVIAGINMQTAIDTVVKKIAGPSMTFPLSIAFAFRDGKGIPDAMGNNSFRPDHAILGGVYDLVSSIQFQDVATNQAALASYTGSGASYASRRTGFNGYIGGHLVTRAAGSTSYTGMYDLEYHKMKEAEALSKGYIPRTFDINNETGERGVTVANNQGGMYDEKGNYHSLAGSAAAGSMKDARDLTETYFGKGMATGTNVATITKSLQQARDQYGIFGGKKVKNPKSLSVIIRDNIRGFSSSPAQAIKDSVFQTPTATRSLEEKQADALNEVQQDNIAEAQAKSLADYKAMVARQQKASRYDDGSNDDGSQSASDQASTADQQGGMFTAKGGFISKGNNFALGGKGEAEPAGFIEGPPEQFNDQTTIADDIPLKVKDGTFVINAPAVEYAGSIDVQKMLAEGYEKAMTRDIGVDKNFRIGKIPSREELDIQISRGEVVVPPHVAKAIGYDRLEKINNRGKREVERRQKAGNQEKVQAGQGFAARKGGKFGVEVTPITQDRFSSGWNAIKNKFKGKDGSDRRNKARDKIAEVLKTFAPQEILAFIAMSESSILGDRGAEGTLHSLMNRVGSNVDDFRPLTDIYSAAVKRFPGQGKDKVFQFNGIEITDFRRYLGEMQDPNSYTLKKFNKYVELADEVMTGQRKDFTGGSTFFWNPKSNKSKSNFFARGIASGRLIPTVTIKGPDGMEHQHLKIKGDDVYERSQFPKDNYIDPKFAQKVGTDTKDSMFAQKDPEFKQLDPKFARKNTTKKVEKDRSSDFFMNFITSHFQDNY